MRNFLITFVSVFAFMMFANTTNAQMHSVSVQTTERSHNQEDIHAERVWCKATGTSDSDYPAVKYAPAGVRIWTIGEVKQFLPKIGDALGYSGISPDKISGIVRTSFGERYIAITFVFTDISDNKEGYLFNSKSTFSCDFDEAGNIINATEKDEGVYYTQL